MKLIVGLGNPGPEYQKTRHNIGFLVIDELERRGAAANFLKPQTFMNRSGEAVKKETSRLRRPLTDLVIVHDDADLPFGQIKMAVGRGSAGHKGVQSIIEAFEGNKNFWRLRFGIGRPDDTALESPNQPDKLEDWVLGRWSAEEKKRLPELVSQAADQIEDWIK